MDQKINDFKLHLKMFYHIHGKPIPSRERMHKHPRDLLEMAALPPNSSNNNNELMILNGVSKCSSINN